MKKLLLSTLGLAAGMSCFAQQRQIENRAPVMVQNATVESLLGQSTGAKSTGNGDTLLLTNIGNQAQGDTLMLPYVWSSPNWGFTSGTNSYGDKAFAERYDFNGSDSSLTVLGVMAYLYGKFGATSTVTVAGKAWAQGPKVKVSNYYFNGYPTTPLAASNTYPIKTVLGTSGNDSLFLFPFTAPTAALTDSFFVGYEINYTPTALAGDTIGLIYTTQGDRNSVAYTASGTDTTINVQNAVLGSNNVWVDEFTQNSNLFHNFALFPIVAVKWTTGVQNVKNRDLAFFGNYPNPANTNTNIKISLNKAANVTVTITDLNGRAISSFTKNLGIGEQIIPVETSQLASGNYIYMIRTSNGGAIASTFTVAR